MTRLVTVLSLLLAAACARDRLSLLERESLLFKTENEKIRAEDLQRAYDEARAKSERLSARLLELARERDRLYAEYDELRAELAGLRRAIEEERTAAVALRAERQGSPE